MIRILIVDDDEMMLKMYSTQLSNEGFEVESIDNAITALQKMSNYLPDIILADIMMPVMSGLELITELKKNQKTKHIPIVAISAFGSDENKEMVLKLGAAEFVEKTSIRPKDLTGIIKRILEKPL